MIIHGTILVHLGLDIRISTCFVQNQWSLEQNMVQLNSNLTSTRVCLTETPLVSK